MPPPSAGVTAGGVRTTGAAGCGCRSTLSRVSSPAAIDTGRVDGKNPSFFTSIVRLPIGTRAGLASGSVPATRPSISNSAPAGPMTSRLPRCLRMTSTAPFNVLTFFRIQGSVLLDIASPRSFSASTQRPSACSARPICASARALFTSAYALRNSSSAS